MSEPTDLQLLIKADQDAAQLRAELATVTAERETALADWRFVIDESAKNRDEQLKLFAALEAVAQDLARELAETKAATAERQKGHEAQVLALRKADLAWVKAFTNQGNALEASRAETAAAAARIAELEKTIEHMGDRMVSEVLTRGQ